MIRSLIIQKMFAHKVKAYKAIGPTAKLGINDCGICEPVRLLS